MPKSFFAKITGLGSEDEEEETAQEQKEEPKEVRVEKAREGQKEDEESWIGKGYEGQLSVDVYQTPDEIVIKSAVAGVKPEDFDISITNDMVTIRGSRHKEEEISNENYFYQECYWGSFSRSIVLPVEVKADESHASFKNGILTLRIPKAKKSRSISIKVKGEEEE